MQKVRRKSRTFGVHYIDLRPYSEKCAGFNVSRPVMYSRQAGKRSVSYINQIYKKFDSNGSESYTAKVKMDGVLKFYGETAWGNFDDFLAGKIIDSD